MSPIEERTHFEELLQQYRRNVQILEQQVAALGGEQRAPLPMINDLEYSRAQVTEIEQKIGRIKLQINNVYTPVLENASSKSRKSFRWNQSIILITSVILGVSGQGFIIEILKFGTNPPSGNITLILIYAAISLVMAVSVTIIFTRS